MKKIIMTGFCQAGSISPAVAIHSFGYHCHGYDVSAFYDALDGNLWPMFDLVDKYDCVRDWPFNLFAREISEEFGDGVVFLHVERESPHKWFDNMRDYSNHGTGRKFAFIFKHWFGKSRLCEEDRADAIRVYERHNSGIRAALGRPCVDLFQFCIDKPDHWKQVCAALGEDPPADVSFPDVNTRMAWVYNTQTSAVIDGVTEPMWDHNTLSAEEGAAGER